MHFNITQLGIGPTYPLTLIAGPCQAESWDLCVEVGTALRDRCRELNVNFVFKASFDKANRSSIHSKRGPGPEAGLDMLARIRSELGVFTTTDIHTAEQAAPAAEAGVDLLQIPAFLCRQTDLLVAAARTGKAVNVKKGQFLSPAEMANVVTKLTEAKASGILLTERGTFFGYHRLVNDFAGLHDLMQLGPPVCFDVTHSTQYPGGEGKSTGGNRDAAPLLARAAAAAGVHALFIETHPDPRHAASDAAVMLPLQQTLDMLEPLVAHHQLARHATR